MLLQLIEDRLRADVLCARRSFDAAATQRRELLRSTAEDSVVSDGVITLQEAQQLYAVAVKCYAHALRCFSDFVVMGKLPPCYAGAPFLTNMDAGLAAEGAD